jgi:ABC-type Fe3+-hydroxamate transport system substrate-binding protein
MALINGAAFVGALALSVAIATGARPSSDPPPSASAEASAPVTDATGEVFAARTYQRIASASPVSDALLYELVSPDRIVAVSAFGATNDPRGFRYAGRPTIATLDDIEGILALEVEVLVVHDVAATGKAARLRAHGVRVFDLGRLEGLASFLDDVRTLGHLVGEEERAEQLADSFARRMAAVAPGPSRARPRAMYLSALAGHLYGGTIGTSHNDVLEHAGLADAAAERFRGYPEYSPEDVLSIDPDWLVTRAGTGRTLCARAGLTRLRACRTGRVIEVAGFVLDDPGLGMLEATEAVFDGVHSSESTAASSGDRP